MIRMDAMWPPTNLDELEIDGPEFETLKAQLNAIPGASDRQFFEAEARIAKLKDESAALPESDEVQDPIWDKIFALNDWILSTPAAALAGVAVKLRILDEWTQAGPHARGLDLVCIGQVRTFVDQQLKENSHG